MDMKHKVLTGDEAFSCGAAMLDTTVKDFWAWSMSRLMGDGPRGDLAEFIVNTALGVDTTIPKKGWGECDIVYNGLRIEIKCSTYLQAWERPSLSKPVFSIAKTINCDIGEFDGGYRYIGRDSVSNEQFFMLGHCVNNLAMPLLPKRKSELNPLHIRQLHRQIWFQEPFSVASFPRSLSPMAGSRLSSSKTA